MDLKKGEPGTYTFGIIDSTKYTGDLTYVDVDSSRGFWSFAVSGYAVGDLASPLEFGAIADTGTSLLYLPEQVVEDYYSQTGASYDSSQGGYTFDCSEDIPDITINIGGYNAVVPGSFIKYAPLWESSPSKFMQFLPNFNCTNAFVFLACFGGIQSSAKIGFSIFGDVFLKSQFVVFDGSPSPRLGFAAKPL